MRDDSSLGAWLLPLRREVLDALTSSDNGDVLAQVSVHGLLYAFNKMSPAPMWVGDAGREPS